MFRIGNQTSCHSQHILDPFEFAITHRFESFEWFFDKNMDGSGLDISRVDASFKKYIKQTADNADLSLSVHAPCNISLYSEKDIRVLHEIINFTIDIKARVLVLHFDSSMGLMGFLTRIENVAQDLSNTDIALALENTPENGPLEFNQFFNTMTTRGGGKVGMAFDIGHANLFRDFRNNYVGYLNALEPHVPINHLHFHENSGESDSHDTIFSTYSKDNDLGIRTVMEILIERCSSANIIFEQWPYPRSLLVDARDRLQKIINQERSNYLKRSASENNNCNYNR
ncbi:MAG: hypothetical protein ACMUIP_00190 [bacterium]